MGILRDVRFEQSEYKVAPGDVVLMMSDGVDTDEIGWIEDELLGFDGEDAQEFADHLLQLALERAGDHEDDMTVLVGAVRKAHKEYQFLNPAQKMSKREKRREQTRRKPSLSAWMVCFGGGCHRDFSFLPQKERGRNRRQL